MPLLKEPETEPIPGYRLIELLGSGGFGEVWKCEAPGGLFKAIKFVNGNLNGLDVDRLQAEQEWKALQRIKDIRHPFILGMERVEVVDGEVVVVMELADRNLVDVFRDCREAGLPGIPRDELLSYFREAAEALDVINLQHRLQHLDVKPANLFLVNFHLKVGDFGLVNGLCDGAEPGTLGGLTPLYCAPETLEGKFGPRSDQYSLAVAYLELVTGTLPYQARNARELMLRRSSTPPDLSALPEAERAVTARALAHNPQQRYPSCTSFIRALAPELVPATAPFLDELLEGGGSADRPRGGRSGTRPSLPRLTVSLRRESSPPPQAPEPPPETSDGFSGYQLVKCLSRGPLCETWKARGPDGRARLLKLPVGLSDGRDSAEAEGLRFLGSLRHRSLLPVEIVTGSAGRVGLVSDMPAMTLADRAQHCQTMGLQGIPRRELLDHLHAIARLLDDLYHQHRLQHLALNPRTLYVESQRALVSDVGLAQLFWLPAGQPVGQHNGRYAAPELLGGEVSPSCDQYSLAVIYMEMLTSASPFRGMARGKSRPSLDLLPSHDRDAVARALSIDPQHRFVTCLDFVEALENEAPGSRTTRKAAALPPAVIPAPSSTGNLPLVGLPSAGDVAALLMEKASAGKRLAGAEAIKYIIDPGVSLTHSCGARLSPSLARIKLQGFCQHWNAETVRDEGNTFVLEVPLSATFWQRCLGRQPAIEVQLQLLHPRVVEAGLTELRVRIRPLYCGEETAAVLSRQAPCLLESLRSFFHVDPERRTRPRLPLPHAVGLYPLDEEYILGEPVTCLAKDVSEGGLGLLCDVEPETQLAYVHSVLTPELAQVAILGRIVRAQRCADGRFEIGLSFQVG